MTLPFIAKSCLVAIILAVLFPAFSSDAKLVANDMARVPRNPASAKMADIDTVAARIAQKLIKSGFKSVTVMELFPDKTDKIYSTRKELTDRLSLALANAPGGIQIVEQQRLINALLDRKWMAIDIYDWDVFTTIAAVEGIQAVVGGKFHQSGDAAELSIWIKSTSDQKRLGEFKCRVTLAHATDQSPDNPVQDSLTGVYLPGFGGVTSPQCKHCPEPDFSPEAREKKIQAARSLLRITVLADGHTSDIQFIKAAGYGLDQNAGQAIRNWQLVPAHRSDGTPVPCRVSVEVKFDHH
jgi:TonB family protein